MTAKQSAIMRQRWKRDGYRERTAASMRAGQAAFKQGAAEQTTARRFMATLAPGPIWIGSSRLRDIAETWCRRNQLASVSPDGLRQAARAMRFEIRRGGMGFEIAVSERSLDFIEFLETTDRREKMQNGKGAA